jgi:transposase-like protein
MKRDLSASRYVYWWVDGIHTGLRQENDARQCLLVIIGVTPEGNKELVTIGDGLRESKESWLDVLRDPAARGLGAGPLFAVGDGALGFWAALDEVFPDTRRQRCWVHKTANVLNALPKSLQAKAKADLHEIWMAPTRPQAIVAFDHFLKTYGAKYPKATDKLAKDREALLAFYDFPAEHWIHRWSPRYVKHSVDDGRKVKIAAIDPDSCEASPLSLIEYAEWRLITCTHSLVL